MLAVERAKQDQVLVAAVRADLGGLLHCLNQSENTVIIASIISQNVMLNAMSFINTSPKKD